MAPPETNIILYTDNTPNGHKISCALEELGLKYEVKKIDISTNTQKEEWFLKINPNGRIPAILDHTGPLSTNPQRIFEGGAILLYLCSRYDPERRLSFEPDSPEHWEAVSWLIWMQSGLGPMQGQANHFFRYAPEKIEYGIKRYQGETRRLYSVIEGQLKREEGKGSGGPWLVGGKLSFADVACFSWVNVALWAGVETDEFPTLKAWKERIESREAVARGLDVPDKNRMKERMKDKETADRYAKEASKWIMQGQENQENAKKGDTKLS